MSSVVFSLEFPYQMNKDIIKLILITIGVIGLVALIIWVTTYVIRLRQRKAAVRQRNTYAEEQNET